MTGRHCDPIYGVALNEVDLGCLQKYGQPLEEMCHYGFDEGVLADLGIA